MFESLKKNIEQEKKILQDIRSVRQRIKSEPEKREEYIKSIHSMLKQIYFLNKSVPELLKEWSPLLNKQDSINPPIKKPFVKPLPSQNVVPSIQKNSERKDIPSIIPKKPDNKNMSYLSPYKREKKMLTLRRSDKKDFLKELKLSESSLGSIDKSIKKEKNLSTDERKPNPYAKFSNKVFRKYSDKMAPGLEDLSKDLKKGNVPFLVSTYISMALMSTILAFLLGFLVYILLIIINFSSNWIHLWIPFVLSLGTITVFYLYPSSEASSIESKIAYELPFATIHMSAIAGSNIEPTKLFGIIAKSKEYPNVGNEMRKVIVQTEIYGFDLVGALKNVSERTPSKKLSELFSGMATNFTTGGELKNFLEQKADNYLLDYKLERQQFSELAGTFMDVYISILIAAPLVLMMLLIVMNVANMDMMMSIEMLMILSILGISLANVIFIVVVNLKQPKV